MVKGGNIGMSGLRRGVFSWKEKISCRCGRLDCGVEAER